MGSAFFTPATFSELRKAIAAARPGTVITLGDGAYLSRIVLSANGTKENPIVLRGSRGAILSSGGISSGVGLTITGDYWRVEGITMTHSQKGVLLDGSVGTVLDGIEVSDTGNEAVHFRKGSSDGVIRNSWIHHTGVSKQEYGEGVYIGSAVSNWPSLTAGQPDLSDRVLVENNVIEHTSAEGVDIKEGTTGGIVRGNTFVRSGVSGANFADSWIDVKGSGYSIVGNSGSGADFLRDAIQVHATKYPKKHPREGYVIEGSGNGNYFSGNRALDGIPDYTVNVVAGSGNVVACDNTHALGAGHVSNIRCS
nr:right-handed parallel beta-helix repeat-containing protein [Motilibacter aurantiacus]